MLLFEGGKTLNLDRMVTKTAIHGTVNVLHKLGLRKERSEDLEQEDQFILNKSMWVRASKSGIWRIRSTGEFVYDRMDTHRRAIENDNEAFFLRITRKGDYLYEGADIGILVLRGRLMTDEFELKDRAKDWIKALKDVFKLNHK